LDELKLLKLYEDTTVIFWYYYSAFAKLPLLARRNFLALSILVYGQS